MTQPTREELIALIMSETTDEIVEDGWRHLGNPNVLVQGCKFIRRNTQNTTEGYQNPEAAAQKFAGFIADAILARLTAAPAEARAGVDEAALATAYNIDGLPHSDNRTQRIAKIQVEVAKALRSSATPDARAETIDPADFSWLSEEENLDNQHALTRGDRWSALSTDPAIRALQEANIALCKRVNRLSDERRALAKDTPADGGGETLEEVIADRDTLIEEYAAASRAIGRQGPEEESLADQIAKLVSDFSASSARVEVLEAASPNDIRALGWSVAVHNDYRMNGAPNTFWLFTKDGHAIKGEGKTDAEALEKVRAALSKPSTEGKGVQSTTEPTVSGLRSPTNK